METVGSFLMIAFASITSEWTGLEDVVVCVDAGIGAAPEGLAVAGAGFSVGLVPELSFCACTTGSFAS